MTDTRYLREQNPSETAARSLLRGLVLLAVGFLLYAATMRGPFQFDDFRAIVDFPAVHSLSRIGTLARLVPTRFLTYASFALNYAASGECAAGYRAVNVLLHILAAWLAGTLVLQLLSCPGFRRTREIVHAGWAAWFASLMFLAHPVQSQPVIYVVQRAALLAAVFSLASLLFYAKARCAPFQKLHLAWALCLLCAFLSKENAFALPFVVVALEFAAFPGRPSRERLRCILPSFVLPVVALAAVFLSILLSGGNLSIPFLWSSGNLSVTVSPLRYFLTQTRVIATYLRLLVFPVNQNLDYDYPVFPAIPATAVIASIFLIICLVLAGVLAYRRGNRAVPFAVAFFFLSLSVESSFFPLRDVIFEHRLYLPFFAFALVTGLLMGRVRRRPGRSAALAACVLLLAPLCVLTVRRAAVWRTSLSLWTDTSKKSPGKVRVLNHLGMALLDAGRPEDAVAVFDRAHRLDPADIRILNNRGRAHMVCGRLSKAEEDFSLVIRMDPGFPQAYDSLGIVRMNCGDIALALALFSEAIRVNPDYANAYVNRATAYGRLGRYRESLADLNRAIRIRPAFAESFYNRGLTWEKLGEMKKAEKDYSRAIRLAPGHVRSLINRGNLRRRAGMLAQAVSDYDRAIVLDPGNSWAYANRGAVRLDLRRYGEAMSDFNRAIALLPENGAAYYNRALALSALGRPEEARRDAKRARQLGIAISPEMAEKLGLK